MTQWMRWFLQWLVPFLCGGAVSLVGSLVGAWRRERTRDRAVELGLQCLLRAEIIRSFEKYRERDCCPIYAKEALKRAYDSYHILGGNDVATGLYRQVMSLPSQGGVRSPQTQRRRNET